MVVDASAVGGLLDFDFRYNPCDFGRRAERMGAGKKADGFPALAQGQEMHGGPRQLLALPNDLLDLPQFRSATPADIGVFELRATDRTLLHGSCLEIEE